MIPFVTENWLKKNTPITDNISADVLVPWLTTSSQNWVKDAIGTYFYNDLLTKYNNQTLSADEEVLVAMFKPAIAWRAASDASIALTFQLKNKGVQTQSGDYSAAAELSEVQFIAGFYADKAAVYERDIYDYLGETDNANLFPNFTSTSNNDSRIKKDKGSMFNQTIMII